MKRVEEVAAHRLVPGDLPGPDERRPLPGQSGGFVIGDGGVDRQSDRSRLGRGPEAQVDPEDIALRVPFLEQLDQPVADPQRPLPRLLARLQRQGRRIVEEEEVDVGRIIELAAAMLAERDDREAARRLVRRALGEGGGRAPGSSARSARSESASISRSSGIAPARSATARAAASALRSRLSAAARFSASAPAAAARAIASSARPASSASAISGKRSSWSLRNGEWARALASASLTASSLCVSFIQQPRSVPLRARNG